MDRSENQNANNSKALTDSQRAIGIFDSGVGGLTVLKSLTQFFPNEDFLYVGDTARLPYGAKSPATIRAYLEQAINFLFEQNVKAIVVACNSASTQLHENDINGVPIYNVIDPGVDAALKATQNNKIGVIGTRATIESKAYQNRLVTEYKIRNSQKDDIEIVAQACPLFVPLVEEGWIEDPVTNLIIYRYLNPLLSKGVDTLILGCTHYPLLSLGIRKVIGNAVNLVDSGKSLGEKMKADPRLIPTSIISDTPLGNIHLRSTDISQHFLSIARGILGNVNIQSNEKIDLRMKS